MAEVELIGVPFDGYGRPGNQAAASAALRAAGLAGALPGHRVADGGDVTLQAPDPRRGERTSLVNEPALLALVDDLGERVARVVADGRFPVVHGGDCTTLLATIPALADAEPVGLLFLDGHEDTMPLDVSEDGEAANTEIGLLLGLTGGLLRGPLGARRGVLGRQRLAVLGPRDGDWRRRFNVGSLRDLGVWFRDSRETAARPEECGREAVRHLRTAARRWWLHVDLDVLDPRALPAQGVPGDPGTPGGLGWEALTAVLRAAVAEGGCLGWSLAIYDPEQDPEGRDAARIVRLVADVAPLIGERPPTP